MAKTFYCPRNWTLQKRLEYYSIPDPASGCTICWAAPKVLNYPGIQVGRQNLLASRVAWSVYRGPIPEGIDVCHHCDFPPCVDPDHLFLGTHADNMADRNRKNRQARLRGEMAGRSKLTQDDALEIFEASGTLKELSKRYGVHFSTIWGIKRKRAWKHIHGGDSTSAEMTHRSLAYSGEPR